MYIYASIKSSIFYKFGVEQCIMKTSHPYNLFIYMYPTMNLWLLGFNICVNLETNVEMNSTSILNVLCEYLYICGRKYKSFFGCNSLPIFGRFETTRYVLATITRKMGVNNFNLFLIFISISPCGFMVFY